MDERVKAIRSDVSVLKGRRRRGPYPRELRSRITELATDWMKDGRSLRELGGLLKIGPETLEGWCGCSKQAATSTSLSPVRLAAEPAMIAVVAASASMITVISPRGWRLEGLAPEEAVALIRAVG